MRSFIRVVSIIALISWMVLIFGLSSQNAELSSQTSGQFIETVAEKFYPDYMFMNEVEREELVASLQFFVRKAAHVGMFAVLGIFAFMTFISYNGIRFWARVLLASSLSVVYAASDEFHQYFVAGRSCELRDFLIDSIGIVVAVLLCTVIVKLNETLNCATAYIGSKAALESFDVDFYQEDADYQNADFETEDMIEYTEEDPEIEEEIQEETFEELEKPVFFEPVVEVEKEEIAEVEEVISEETEEIAEIEDLEVSEEAEVEEIAEVEEEILEETEAEDAVEILETEDLEEVEAQEVEEIVETQDVIEEDVIKEIETAQENDIISQLEQMPEPPKTKVKTEVKLSDDTEYAAKVIGEAVIEVTKVCNKITMSANAENQKELVNLALGRCEVLKSEILKIVGCEITFEAKKDLIEKERKDAFDYFDSIKAQML